jgi:diacylglycerol kinase
MMSTAVGWRDRRRSRVREVSDGAAMLFMDVAVVRTLVVVCIMLVVAFLARRHSKFVTWLVAAAVFFMFCEMFNTITEMLVDRISLANNAFSARIKHASAFVSAVSGIIAFSLFFVVLYNLLIAPNKVSQPTPESNETPHRIQRRVSPTGVSPTGVSPTGDSPTGDSPTGDPTHPPTSKIVHPRMWERRVMRKKRYRSRGYERQREKAGEEGEEGAAAGYSA